MMEFFAELWAFSTSPYGIWLWCLPVFIAVAAWSDWIDYRNRKRELNARLDEILQRHRRK